jgi:hypothetical protein
VYDVSSGKVFVSQDGGQEFKVTEEGLPELPAYNLMVAKIVTVPDHEGHIWVSTGKEVFRSTNSGASFDMVKSMWGRRGAGSSTAIQRSSGPHGSGLLGRWGRVAAATAGGRYSPSTRR